jgi:acyl-CoA synthetase (AMP-forming)/AMP-acid ligase II
MFQHAQSLSHLLRDVIARHAAAGRTALVGPRWSMSYATLGVDIDRWANALHGIGRGEPVGVLGWRQADDITLFFGIMQAGGCPCFLEPHLGSEATLARMRATGMRRIFLHGDADSMADDLSHAGMQVSSAGHPVAAEPERAANGIETLTAADGAMMQFTSGSSSQPKAVLLTHGNLLCNAEGIIARTDLTSADRLLHVMPLHHTNGVNNQLIAPFIAGATVVFIETFEAAAIESQLREYDVTYMTGVPTMYSRVLSHLSAPATLPSLRFLRCGSAPITVGLHQQIEDAFGVPLIVSYGLSEATCTSTMNPPAARRIGTIGTVLRGQRVRLFAPGTIEEVAVDAEGEICISGDSLMKGYLGHGSERPILDGCLRTGDLGRFDDAGYLTITGRLKDVIIRGGENLSPHAIETVLGQHPAVAACCVVGGPHPDLGEVPVAFVQRRQGMTAEAEELKAFVMQGLSRQYAPTSIHFVDALPETSVGKVDRKALGLKVDGS